MLRTSLTMSSRRHGGNVQGFCTMSAILAQVPKLATCKPQETQWSNRQRRFVNAPSSLEGHHEAPACQSRVCLRCTGCATPRQPQKPFISASSICRVPVVTASSSFGCSIQAASSTCGMHRWLQRPSVGSMQRASGQGAGRCHAALYTRGHEACDGCRRFSTG